MKFIKILLDKDRFKTLNEAKEEFGIATDYDKIVLLLQEIKNRATMLGNDESIKMRKILNYVRKVIKE